MPVHVTQKPRPTFTLTALSKSVAFLSLVGVSAISVIGCSSVPTATQSTSLKSSIYQGQEQLVSRQSYAYDFNFNLVKPDTPLNAPNPQRQTLLDQLVSQNQLSPAQKSLYQQGLMNHYDRYEQRSKVFDKYLERLFFSGKGVNDLGSGQFSVVPQAGYQANNAYGYIRMPLAVDLRQSKAYVDMSALSVAVIDPQYEGRYVVYDYQEWLKKSNLDVKPLFGFMKELMLLEPTVANESDYQMMALTATDKQKGAAKRIRYQGDYDETIAKTALFTHINKQYLDKIAPKSDDENHSDDDNAGQLLANSIIELATSRNMAFYSTMGLAKLIFSESFKKDQKSDEVSLDDIQSSAESAAYRIDNSFNTATAEAEDVSSSDCGCSSEAYDSDESAAKAAAVVDVEAARTTADEEETTDPLSPEEQAEQHYKDALAKFDTFHSDHLITAREFNQILTAHPKDYAEYLNAYKAMFAKQPTGTITSDYLLDKQGKILSVEILTPMNSNPYSYRKLFGSDEATKLHGVMNFYDYGKAKIDSSIAKNAVTYEQAIGQNSVVAMSRQEDKNDKQTEKTERTIANNLLASHDFVTAYTQLYQYEFIKNLDNDELKENDFDGKLFDPATLKQAAYQQALSYAHNHHKPMTASQQADFDSLEFDEDSDYITYRVKESTEALLARQESQRQVTSILQNRGKGLSQTEQFALLYQYFAEQNADDDNGYDDSDYAYATTTTTTVTASTVVIDTTSEYDTACQTLQENDGLDSKSRKNLDKICEKIAAQPVAVAEPAYESQEAQDAPRDTAKTLANDKSYQAFIKALSEIAISEINAKPADLNEEDDRYSLSSPLVEKLNAYNDYQNVFDKNAYKQAYAEMLKQRFNVTE